MNNQNSNFNNYNDCNNCNRNNNNGQQTIYGLIILILVCVAGYLYAQNLHLQKEVDHYKYYFDDDYSDSDDDSILSQILKPFTGSSDSDDGWIYDDSYSGSGTVHDIDDAISDFSGEVDDIDDAKSRME